LHKDGSKIVLQAKRYTAKVGISAVQQITAAKSYYGANTGIVVTNNYYTGNAIELAECNDIELWDRNKLIQIMAEAKKAVCPICGNLLVKREGSNGNFYGCSNYPKCKFTKSI
jgi:restriction system protein